MKTMKKILFFAVSALLLLLTGCSKEMAQAVPEATTVQSSAIPLKPVRINISANLSEWTNEDNPNGKMVVEYSDENWNMKTLELEWDNSEQNIIYTIGASIRLVGCYYKGSHLYTGIGIVTDMEEGNNTGEPYYREYLINEAGSTPQGFNIPVAIAHDGSDFDINIVLTSADREEDIIF